MLTTVMIYFYYRKIYDLILFNEYLLLCLFSYFSIVSGSEGGCEGGLAELGDSGESLNP